MWNKNIILVLICIFLVTHYVKHLLCLLAIYVFFGEMSIQILCPFFYLGCLSFCYWIVRVPCIFWALELYQICDKEIFLSFSTLSFHFFDNVHTQNDLVLMKSSLSIFFFCYLMVLMSFLRLCCQIQRQEDLPSSFLVKVEWFYYIFRLLTSLELIFI